MKRMKWAMLVSFLLACMLLSACSPKEPEGSQGLELYPTGIQIIAGGDFTLENYECEVLGIGSFDGSDLVIPSTHTFEDLAEPLMQSAKEKGDKELMKKAKDFLKSFTVIEIADHAFEGCTQLKSVRIPDTITKIGSNAFADCTQLESIEIPDSVTQIGECAFENCALRKVILSENITQLGVGAFEGCPDEIFNEYEGGLYLGSKENPYLVLVRLADVNAKSFAIHHDTKLVADAAFAGCEALLELAVPYNTIIIPKGSFDSCIHIQTADLPQAEGLDYVLNDDGASYSISGIGSCEMVYFSVPTEHEGLPVTGIVSGAFSYDFAEYEELSKNYRIFLRNGKREGISTEEANKLFAAEYGSKIFDMQKLEAVEMIALHSEITNIGENAFGTMRVFFKNDNPEYRIENGCIIHTSSRTLIRGSQEGIIPEYIVRIGAGAFSGLGVEHVVIPDSVIYIGDRAFAECDPKTVVIGNGVTNIGTDAFAYCERTWYVQNKSEIDLFATNHKYSIFGASTVIVDESGKLLPHEEQWDNTYVLTDDGFFYRKGNGGIDIGDLDAKEFTLLAYIGSDQTVTLPLTLDGEEYDLSSFSTFAEHVVIPEGVETITSGSFASCDMGSVTIPASVKVIEESAFNNCDGLKDVYFGGSQGEWESITIDESNNYYLLNSTIHYNSVSEE